MIMRCSGGAAQPLKALGVIVEPIDDAHRLCLRAAAHGQGENRAVEKVLGPRWVVFADAFLATKRLEKT